jgi:diguanylate cyclase (GGDEF)-like protein
VPVSLRSPNLPLRRAEISEEGEPPVPAAPHAQRAEWAECLARCKAHISAGEYLVAQGLATALYEATSQQGDHATAAQAALVLAKSYANTAEHSSALVWADATLQCTARVADANTTATAWVIKGSVWAASGSSVQAVAALDRALSLIDEHTAPAVSGQIFTGVGLAYLAMSMPMRALAAHRKVLAILQAQSPLSNRLRLRVNVLHSAAAAYDMLVLEWPAQAAELAQTVQDEVEQAEREATAINTPNARAAYCSSVGMWWRRTGRHVQACALLQELLLIPHHRLPSDLFESYLELALAQQACGDAAAAAASAALARQCQPPTGAMPSAAVLLAASQLAQLSGEPAQALQLYQRYHAHVVRNEQAAFEARVAELSATLSALSLRQENADLRRRNEGLADTFQRLTDMASTDPLTGVANRRGLQSIYETLLASGRPFVLAMFDLDHFKKVNDQHSHIVGDQVLRHTAAVLSRALRAGDCLGRFGGEEFTLLLPDTPLDESRAVLDRLQEAALGADWQSFAPGLRITFSGGAVAVAASEPFEGAVARADQLLYRAKAQGRDRILCDTVAGP